MNYSQKLLNHFHHTSHAGCLDTARDDVLCARVGSHFNRDVLQLFVLFQDEKIKKAYFLAHGSPVLIACAQFICDWLTEKSFSQISLFAPSMILKELDLPTTFVHVISLIQDAINQILKDYHGTQTCIA